MVVNLVTLKKIQKKSKSLIIFENLQKHHKIFRNLKKNNQEKSKNPCKTKQKTKKIQISEEFEDQI